MRVLQIVVPPAAHKNAEIGIGGPERRAANLIHHWKAHDIQPIVCYPKRGKLWDNFAAAGVELIDFEIGSKFNFLAASRIAQLGRRHHARLIHTQGPPSLDMLACIGGSFAGLPVVITRPSMIDEHVTRSRLRRGLYRRVDQWTGLRMAQRIVAVSSAGYEYLRNRDGVDEHRLRLIHNGIDVQRFPAGEHNNHDGSERLPVVIGMVGQLTPAKGWLDFIEVIERLLLAGVNVRGLAVGEGPERKALQLDVVRRNLQQYINFTGFRADVSNVYQQMDLFLFTSYREGLSVAVIEALASGLPIVATQVGGIHEQVEDGVNGQVVKAGDINAMVGHCVRLVSNQALRRSMGLASRQIAEQRFSEDRMLEQYVSCYREVAALSERSTGALAR